MGKTVLILGQNGRFGRHASTAFAAAGWHVRGFERGRDDLEIAAREVDVIVNAWNPPYTRWAADLPDLTKQVIEAARQNNATVILPGNVYVFGALAPARFAEDTPHRATNPLGKIRVAMEAAYRDSGVQTIILRAGDFIDTEASGNWFDKVMIAKLDKGRFTYPGNPVAPHAWAWLPDIARAAVALAERRGELATFEDVPFEGYTLCGHALAKAIGATLGRDIALSKMSYVPLFLLAPVWPMGRKLLEMRYLWSKPHRLDGARFKELLPDFEATPIESALRQVLGAVDIHPDQPVARGAVFGVAEQFRERSVRGGPEHT